MLFGCVSVINVTSALFETINFQQRLSALLLSCAVNGCID